MSKIDDNSSQFSVRPVRTVVQRSDTRSSSPIDSYLNSTVFDREFLALIK